MKASCTEISSQPLPGSRAFSDLLFTPFLDHLRASLVSIHRLPAWLRYPETTRTPSSNLPAFSFASLSLRGSRASTQRGFLSSFQSTHKSDTVAPVTMESPEMPNQALQRTAPGRHSRCLPRGLGRTGYAVPPLSLSLGR